jgi:Na+-transporting methylmalonyl-CoA/oxaloacetate decarboxylase gamma subunit
VIYMRKRTISAVILGLFMIVSLLGAASMVAAQEHQISGHVYEEGTSWGIDGANVHIEGDSSWDITTDSSGFYSIWVPNGGYSISVSASGYYDQDSWVNVEEESVTQDFHLSETYGDGNGGGGNGNGNGDNGGDGNGENGLPDEFNQLGEQVGSYMMLCGAIFIVLVIAFLVMAIASVGIFVRLGKIRKELKSPQAQQPAQQSQQPLPPVQQATAPQIPPQPVNNPVQQQQPDAQMPNEQQSQPSQGDAP